MPAPTQNPTVQAKLELAKCRQGLLTAYNLANPAEAVGSVATMPVNLLVAMLTTINKPALAQAAGAIVTIIGSVEPHIDNLSWNSYILGLSGVGGGAYTDADLKKFVGRFVKACTGTVGVTDIDAADYSFGSKADVDAVIAAIITENALGFSAWAPA
jgi:hypothetical protein